MMSCCCWLSQPASATTTNPSRVNQGQLLMTQRERDRLVSLNKADKKLITQKQATQQIGRSEQQVRRLLESICRICGETDRLLDKSITRDNNTVYSATLLSKLGLHSRQ